MRHSTKKKQKGALAIPGDDDQTVNLQPARVATTRDEDSQAIERAVYDGMQDLRAKKPRRK
jgi:hypothetical protein